MKRSSSLYYFGDEIISFLNIILLLIFKILNNPIET